MKTSSILALTILLSICGHTNGQTLRKLWETDTLLKRPESAIYDKANNIIYASNINGKYFTKDGNGFISKIGLNGKIDDLKWVTGLDAPQGLGLFNNKLYVADVNQLVVIDIAKAAIERRYVIDSARYLNDVATDQQGNVYVTECRANKIFRLSNDSITLWLVNPLLKGANGLLCEEQRVFVLNMGNETVYCVDKNTKAMTVFCQGIKNCDGIVSDGNDGYYVSGAWQGELFHLNKYGEKTLLLNLGPQKTIIADIDYIPQKKILLVPTLNKTLQAYSCE